MSAADEIKRAAHELKQAARTVTRAGKTTNVRVTGRRNVKIVRNVGGSGASAEATAVQNAPIVQD